SYQSGSVTPSRPSTSRSSPRPPPSDLRACATTATWPSAGAGRAVPGTPADPSVTGLSDMDPPSHIPPAGLAQPVDAEDDQAERGDEQQDLAQRLAAQGVQGLVDAAGLGRVVGDRGLDHQDAGQGEDHTARDGPDHAQKLDG